MQSPRSSGIKPVLALALTQWRGWVAIAAATLLGSIIQLLHPWPLQLLIDDVLGSHQLPRWLGQIGSIRRIIILLASAQVMIFIADQAMVIFLSDAWIRFGQKLVYDLTRKLFANAQRRSLVFHSQSQIGDLISRITGDSWCVYNVASALIFTPAHALIMTIAMGIILCKLNVELALIAIAIAPLLAVAAIWLGRLSRGAAHLQRESESRIESHVQQTLSGIPVVQSFAQEDRQHREFVQMAGAAIATQRRSAVINSVAHLLGGGISSIGTAIVLLIGAQKVLAGALTTGELLVFLAYLGALHGQMVTLATTWIGAQGTAAGIDRVSDLLCTPPEVRDAPDTVPMPKHGEIRFENVWFGYDPGRPVLRGISFTVTPGETLAIVGGSGAGKSTLASLLLRLFDPQHGRILIGQMDLRHLKLAELRKNIAVVLQEPFLQAATVSDNIRFGCEYATAAEVEAAALAASAHDFITRLDDGYNSELGEAGVTLSGGERQRIALARALVKNAPILLLDEPSSALDSVTEAAIFESLSVTRASGPCLAASDLLPSDSPTMPARAGGPCHIGGSRTTILIAHRLSTARDADRILVLENGRVAEIGSHEQLLANDGTYARLWAMQHRGNTLATAEAS
jgi:ATP-binding cassette subfamily B protein/subfamily B ATP-binding cassette protein MsbA